MSTQIERAVLASILFDQDVVIAAQDRGITAEMFSTPDHRSVYAAMAELAAQRIAPDLVAVSDALERQGMDDATLKLADLMGEEVRPMAVGSYLDTFLAHHRARVAKAAAARFIEEVSRNPHVDVEALVTTLFHDLAHSATMPTGPQPFAAYAEAMAERLAMQAAGTWAEQIVTTGLPTLDKRLGGGFRGGELIVLAARPSMGKSALALKLAREAAVRHGPVLLASLEMTGSSIYERAVADLAGMSLDAMRVPKLNAQHLTLLERVNRHLAGVPVAIDDTAGLTTDQLAMRAARFQAEHGLSAVVVDYLQIMGDAKGKGENDQYRVARMSQGMKQLAMRVNVPVVMLSQLNREVERRNPPIPQLADLRDSGAIEQDADAVMMLYRHDYYSERGMATEDPSRRGTCDVLIQKQRNGATGSVPLRFRAETMTFSDPTEPTYLKGAAD
jgi:replicative DNA helicase